MTTPLDPVRRAQVRAAFRMPSIQKIISRKSTITNAFASSVIPAFEPSDEEIDEALRILSIDPADLRCAFCGDRSTEWDHLRPLVIERRATGFISEIANLVPACGKCNQSKGNKGWRLWMESKARLSPTGRNIADVAARIERLLAYEQWREPKRLDIQAIIGEELWREFWGLCDRVVSQMQASQLIADDIKRSVEAFLAAERLPPGATGGTL